MGHKKQRVDVLLVQQGLVDSREKARRLIMAGQVFSGDQRMDKAGTKIDADTELKIKGSLLPYVSRGGLKLAKALQEFSVEVNGKVALDIGASTGGFTDCLLQHGAAKVYAIDVGYGQLAWKLRQDPRVVVWERTNIRHVEPDQLDELGQLATVDVAFISLTKIFAVVATLLGPQADLIALIKPQFEAGPGQVGKNGIVRNPKVHETVLLSVLASAGQAGFSVRAVTFSPVTGADGNIEFLGHFVKEPAAVTWPETGSHQDAVSKLVQSAWDSVGKST